MGIKQVKDGCWTFGDGERVCYPWSVAEDGGGAGGCESGTGGCANKLKLIQNIKLAENVSTIEITTDSDGNPLNENHIIVTANLQSSTGAKFNTNFIVNNNWVSGATKQYEVPTGWFGAFGCEVYIVETDGTTNKQPLYVIDNLYTYEAGASGVNNNKSIKSIKFNGDFLAGSIVRIFRVI